MKTHAFSRPPEEKKPKLFSSSIKHWKLYQIEGLNDIEEVIESTQIYKDNNDPYQEFITEYIIKQENNIIQWTDLQSKYEKWFVNMYKNKPANGKQIKQAFIEKLFDIDCGPVTLNKKSYRGWKGYKLIDDDDNDTE